jgi:hypothetical protein
MSHEAVEQGDEADEAKRIGASQLIPGVRRTMGRRAMTRRVALLAVSFIALCCTSTHHYARRPEAERSARVFSGAICQGMTLQQVVRSMIESRLPRQSASLSSATPGGDTVKLVLHADELLAKIGDREVFLTGFASIELYRAADKRLQSYGFERQGLFLSAVEHRQQELLANPKCVAAFDATVEGSCGESTVAIDFDASGRVRTIGQVQEGECPR